MTEPLVSILIPCFNASAYVEQTLASVLAQTWPNIEIIVVDDGSSDDSVLQVDAFASRGVKLLRQENAGAAAARNRAFAHSQGDYVQFLDADDLISSDKVASQLKRLLDAPRHVASCAWGRFVDSPAHCAPNPESVWRDMDPLDWLAESRADGLGMMFPALWLIPRDVALAAGPWNESLSLADDTEYFTRVLIASRGVKFCDGFAFYRSSVPGSLSARKSARAWDSAFDVQALCEEHLLAAEDSQRLRSAIARSWHQFAFACYGHEPRLAEEAMRRANAMQVLPMQVPGGPKFRLAANLIGWRQARRVQSWWHGGRI